MKPADGTHLTPDPAIESAAAEWLVRHDRGLTAAEQDAFLTWLAASAAHREAFERHRGMWRDFDALAAWRPEHGAEPNDDLLAPPRRRPRWPWAAAGTLAAAAAVAVLLRPARVAPPAEVTFAAADYRQEKLADGSVLDLNRGAHAVVRFTAAERRVLLLAGEAQFTVARNPARPFVVHAGGVDVRAVGTAFNVRLASAGVEVLVTEGTVHVSPPPAPAAPSAPPLLAALTAGQGTLIPAAPAADAPPAVVAVAPAEIERRLEWRPRLLDFDATPLAEVVAAFNRRNARRLVIGDPALAALPIVASIRSDNFEGFVRLLEATMGVRAERPSADEIVLHRAR